MGIDCEGLSKLVDVGIYSKDELIAIQDDKIKETVDNAEIDETYLRKLWEEAKGLKISAVEIKCITRSNTNLLLSDIRLCFNSLDVFKRRIWRT